MPKARYITNYLLKGERAFIHNRRKDDNELNMEFKLVIYEKSERIATITLNRPEALNAWSKELTNEFFEALKDAQEDEAIRAIIITGAGEKAFSAGADIKAMKGMNALKARALSQRGDKICSALESIEKPIIAAINGYALGGGLEISMACDFRIASENARLGQTEINIGLIPGWGGTQRLIRLVSKARAKELVYTGKIIDAKTAYRWGLVNKVVPATDLMTETRQFAKELASKAPIAIKVAKSLIERGADTDLKAGLALEREGFGVVASSMDLQEGISAFTEKRTPEWKGR
ncbi:MAG: enoyl-CoA hydratase/isomerase family protein [Candidatus Bathyarchaeota archaeon]|nr:MAG: enoyl-CoA hydratase/isomerase family protein [Candidatus Bathyarchaeota archaeon]